MDIEEIVENPAFWILGGGAVIAETIGWIMSRSWETGGIPVWQFLILILGTLVAAAAFANKS